MSECPVHFIFIDRVISNETGSFKPTYAIHFNLAASGILTISDFPEPQEKINLYIKASAGELAVVPSDPVFICTLVIMALPPPVVNIPPTFELPLIPKHLNFTNKDNTDGSEKGFTFPKVYDSEGTKVDLAITGGMTKFMKYDKATNKLVCKPSSPDEFGTFFVTITLTDASGAFRNYVQTIILTAPEPEKKAPPNVTETVIKRVAVINYVEIYPPKHTLKAEITNIDKYGIVYIEYTALKSGKKAILDSKIFKDPTPVTPSTT
jgi:hypothetical protein